MKFGSVMCLIKKHSNNLDDTLGWFRMNSDENSILLKAPLTLASQRYGYRLFSQCVELPVERGSDFLAKTKL